MNRRLKLINWVKAQHDGQLIKDTNAPYFDHVLAVANHVAGTGALNYEIGLCHDLLEKTTVTSIELLAQIKGFGYEEEEAGHINSCVNELTRQFTKADNPLPKKMRKALEDERLLQISPDSQTVKYADFSYNAGWMMTHDRHHAKDYLTRHIELIKEMTDGNTGLREEVLKQLYKLLAEVI
ncbi:hypothetical protein ACFQZS_05460 [Mucilaginibacter calamicampi]|uniref:HD domain-containing protein n=1 Tax=Mucilaginibacter calamicampi TaxID=1302352 RepID=A0ABW2YUC5_9SPHI